MLSIEARKNFGRFVLLVVGLFVLLHCLAVLLYVARQPWKGFNVFEGRRVAEVYRHSSADGAGIRPDDVVLSIDNQTLLNSVDVVRATKSLDDKIGRTVPVVVQHPGEEPVTREITVLRTPFPLRLLLWLLVCAGVVSTAYVFFLRRSEDRSTALFYLMCVIYCGAFMDAFAWNVIIGNMALIATALVWAALLAPVTLHFFLVYPQTNVLARRLGWMTAIIYLPSAVYLTLMIALTWRITGPRYDAAVAADVFVAMQAVSLAQIVLTLVYYALAMLSLWHCQRTTLHTDVKNQIKWVWWGVSTAVPSVLMMIVLVGEGLSKNIFGGIQFWAMLATFGGLVATGLSLLKFRLMYVDTILNRSLGYVVVSAMMMAVYVGAVGIASLLLSQVTGDVGQVPFLISVLVIAFLFRPVSDRVQTEVDKRFYRERYELQQAVYETSQAIVGTLDLDRVLRQLIDAVMNSLHAKRGAILLCDPTDRKAKPAAARGYLAADELLTLGADDPLYARLVRERASLTTRELLERASSAGEYDETIARLVRMNAEVVVPIFREDEMLGVLVLGRKLSRQIYSSADLRLLRTLANHAAIAIQNARTYRSMERLNRDLQANLGKIEEQRREILGLQTQLLSENVYLKQEIEEKYNFQDIVGMSPGLREVLETVKKVAPSASAVLVRGESGTGKELVARAIHYNSPRRDKPFVRMNCAVFTESLLESELFGHDKGAFTGAVADRPGRFEVADGGTIFLDEIGDVSPRTQVRLLRVLQEKEFERVGSNLTRKVDVRVIAATNRDLEALMKQGQFREDLFYRLNVISIEVPPLRERREDLFPLAIHFANRYARSAGKPVSGIDPEVLELFKRYRWPGNIRELENLIERAVVLSDGPTLTVNDFPVEMREPERMAAAAPKAASEATSANALNDRLDSLERESLAAALRDTGGNRSRAARKLGIARTTLISKLKKYGIE